MANNRLMNAAQGDSIITALQTIAQKSESPYHSENKLNPAYIDTGALANGMTATTQLTGDDSTKLATTAFVHDVVNTLPTPMVYKGTLGTGGTITTLPVDGSADVGDVYKVITAGTYASQAAKIGDIFICHTKTSVSNAWDYIPAGDDVDVTEVSAGVGLTTQSGSAITTTGTIKAKLQNETKLGANATTVSNPGSLTTNIHPVLTDDSGNLAIKVDKSDVGLGNVTNNAQVKKISSSTSGNIVTWGGTDGATVSDSGKAIATTFANNANQIPTGAAITSGVTDTATMAGYTIDPSSSPAAITTGNTINEAIGKLEKTASINKNNILAIYNQNGKTFNVIDWSNFGGNSDVGIKYSYANDTITAVGSKLTSDSYLSIAGASSVIKTNTWYALVCTITGSPRISARIFGYNGSTYTQLSDSASLAYFNSGNYQSYICRIVVAGSSGDSVNATIKPMLIEKSIYDAGFTDYQPYALSNAELTAKEQVNENNIVSLTANGGGKNKLNITATSSAEMTINADRSVSITVNASTQKNYDLTGWIPNNYVGMRISGMTVNSNSVTGFFISVQYSNTGSSWANETNIATIGSAEIKNYPYIKVSIVVRGGNNLNGVLFKPMISDNGEPYQPHALSNAELTTKERANENNILLLEQMNGAKNLYKFEDLGATAGSGTGVTLTDNGDGTFSATGTASGANYARYLLKQAPIKAGNYVISGISGGALETYRLRVGTGSGDAYIVNLENNYAQFTIATDTTVTVQLVVNSGVTVTNLSIKPMIITKAMYDAGFTDYQPYALSNAELTKLSKWNYTETRFTNTGTSDYENTGISFTAPANQSIEFYAYDRKDGAYLDKILVCDSLTTLGNTTIVSANSIIDGFTDAQYWTLQTTGIVPTFNTDVTYYVWVKRKSTGSNPVGLAWRYLSQ